MRAPSTAACAALLLLAPAALVLCQTNGYHVEENYQLEDVLDVVDADQACPSSRLLRTRELCRVDGADVQCIRFKCCDTHTFIAGRCIPKSVDPCSLKLCEQACEVKDAKVWCSCYSGFQFHLDNYRRKAQPFCVDIDECSSNNGGCEQRCINDPGGYHCECAAPLYVANDGKKCERRVPLPITIPEPLPLIRASSRCYAPCDTVSWLSRKVKLLNDQLHTTQAALKKLIEASQAKSDGADIVMDATAPLEGGFCRCERGPRGPQGPPGMEGPKGDAGPRGPRGARGPKGSLDLMLLMIADIRHDIHNLEAKVYKEGEKPERFNLQKAWQRHRKQERLDQENRAEQELEAYTASSVESTVHVSPNGLTGEIPRESTTDWSTKADSDPPDLGMMDGKAALEKLRRLYMMYNNTAPDEEDNDYDYSFY